MALSEAAYQKKLVDKILDMFPGCYIFKNDPDQRQGIPDLLILFGARWAMLEVKKSMTADIQPNQEYYVDLFGEMSFAAFIYPENEGQVLYELEQAFGARRKTRVS